MLLGLTGLIGSGKSTAARILADAGAHIIDADRIGHRVLETSATVRRKLAGQFGSDILNRDGSINKPRLAERAFTDQALTTKLNNITHPYLLKELRQDAKNAAREHKLVVIDAALLLYWKMDDVVDFVIVVHAGKETRHARMIERGLKRSQVEARERSQLPFSEFRRRADRLIMNNGTVDDLRRKLRQLLRRLNSEKAVNRGGTG